jgi:hypothetical protein
MILDQCKQKLSWVWRHRTKTLGGLGIAAGGIQAQLASHPEVHLPHEGTLLMGFGALVMMVGTYNSIAAFFGWNDAP